MSLRNNRGGKGPGEPLVSFRLPTPKTSNIRYPVLQMFRSRVSKTKWTSLPPPHHPRHVEPHGGTLDFQTPTWNQTTARCSRIGHIDSSAAVGPGDLIVVAVRRVVIAGFMRRPRCQPCARKWVDIDGSDRIIAVPSRALLFQVVRSQTCKVVGHAVHARSSHDNVVVGRWRHELRRQRWRRIVCVEGRRIV